MTELHGDGASLSPEERWAELKVLQEEYKEFRHFLYDVVTGLMGFQCTQLQLDIALYLQFGPTYRMIQAQRGQAKTTITACYAVWRLIHNPSCRILIISSGDSMATEISNWVIQILSNMPELRCLLPDRSLGDRASVEAYDVHRVLKGPEKSPSIACAGITSNLQGKRADVLIADDIESAKNSATDVQRERLKHLSRDFTSICSTGDIIYLGTPQSINSVYNGLASRGFDIRIWPGRYPTPEEVENYGAFLAPVIAQRIKEDPNVQKGGGPLGDRGKPTDPVLLGEDILTKKEIDQGAAYFQLQHMLDTKLMDKERFPLAGHKLVFMRMTSNRVPIIINHVIAPEYRVHVPNDFPLDSAQYYRASSFGDEFAPYIGTHMYVDPAGGGQNGDEIAFAVTSFLAQKVHLRHVGGVRGGYEPEKLDLIAEIAKKYDVQKMSIEENFGKGAFANILRPRLHSIHPACSIEEVWESGQKELRIIDTLEPVISSGRLVVDEECLKQDVAYLKGYAVQNRPSYSFFYQLARITKDRDSLIHDDRLDAVAGSVRNWVEALKQDEQVQAARVRNEAYAKLMADPLGTGRPVNGWSKMNMSRLEKRKRL